MEWRDVVVKWIRARTARRTEPAGQQCTGCLSSISGATDEELTASGGVFLAGGGWFCGPRCERQYRLRFRIQSDPTPSAGSPRSTPTPRPAAPVDPASASDTEEAQDPEARRSAADALAAALRARRRRFSSGV